MTFQKVVLTISIVLLILCLIFIGVMLYQSKYSAKFPPVTGACPDYWVNLGPQKDHNGMSMCVPPGFVDPDTGKKVSPAIAGYGSQCKEPKYVASSPSNSEICDLTRWAKKCNLSWDGVTNSHTVCK